MSVREFLDGVKYIETPCVRLGAQSEEQGEQELSEGAPLFSVNCSCSVNSCTQFLLPARHYGEWYPQNCELTRALSPIRPGVLSKQQLEHAVLGSGGRRPGTRWPRLSKGAQRSP